MDYNLACERANNIYDNETIYPYISELILCPNNHHKIIEKIIGQNPDNNYQYIYGGQSEIPYLYVYHTNGILIDDIPIYKSKSKDSLLLENKIDDSLED
jgi:hypothetical protein